MRIFFASGVLLYTIGCASTANHLLTKETDSDLATPRRAPAQQTSSQNLVLECTFKDQTGDFQDSKMTVTFYNRTEGKARIEFSKVLPRLNLSSIEGIGLHHPYKDFGAYIFQSHEEKMSLVFVDIPGTVVRGRTDMMGYSTQQVECKRTDRWSI